MYSDIMFSAHSFAYMADRDQIMSMDMNAVMFSNDIIFVLFFFLM